MVLLLDGASVLFIVDGEHVGNLQEVQGHDLDDSAIEHAVERHYFCQDNVAELLN